MFVSFEQPLNISLISVTLLVFKGVRSRVVNPEQPENISLISVTLLVFKGDKLRLIILRHP